jgi:hypothetical protein
LIYYRAYVGFDFTDALNKWTEMELQLGVEQVRIRKIIVAWNLKKETLGKVAVLCNGKYPCSVLYDMGRQKASTTYDSLSGQGLMIGYRTQRVIAVQNYSKVCSICNTEPGGKLEGREGKGCPGMCKEVWSRRETRAFIDVICIDDDASTRAYLSHGFADLDETKLPCPTTKAGVTKTSKRDNKGKTTKEPPTNHVLSGLMPPSPNLWQVPLAWRGRMDKR